MDPPYFRRKLKWYQQSSKRLRQDFCLRVLIIFCTACLTAMYFLQLKPFSIRIESWNYGFLCSMKNHLCPPASSLTKEILEQLNLQDESLLINPKSNSSESTVPLILENFSPSSELSPNSEDSSAFQIKNPPTSSLTKEILERLNLQNESLLINPESDSSESIVPIILENFSPSSELSPNSEDSSAFQIKKIEEEQYDTKEFFNAGNAISERLKVEEEENRLLREDYPTSELENREILITEKKFLVFSEICQIPDIDPMHGSIKDFVNITEPLNCKEKEPLTRLEENWLILDDVVATRSWNLNRNDFKCCYSPFYRLQRKSDNSIRFGPCRSFYSRIKVPHEFIRVECTSSNGTAIYKNFYSLVHEKPNIESRGIQHSNTTFSVLIIGVDSVSRMNMHRQLKKTYNFLMDHMGAVEMFGFNKVGDNTFPNLIPLLTGYDERELKHVCWNGSRKEPFDDCNFIWKSFASKGYRTLYAEDTPDISTFNYLKKGFVKQPTDYYFRPFITAYADSLAHRVEDNSNLCVGYESQTEAVLNWTKKFAQKFKDRPYFAFSWINSATHDNMNSASSVDHFYKDFFQDLQQSGALNKTIVLLLADHGMRWGLIRKTFIGRLEERLPMLLIALPPEFRKKYPTETESLRLNSHRLMTPFDLHATLVNVLHLDKNWSFSNPDNVKKSLAHNFTNRALTLFKPVPEERSCFDASIDEHWCTCENSSPLNPENAFVQKAAEFIIDQINLLLEPVNDVCATLELGNISDARTWARKKEHIDESTVLTLIVTTKYQYSSSFEATVRLFPSDMRCELLGTISRIDPYGNKPWCVKNAILRKYCFCKLQQVKLVLH